MDKLRAEIENIKRFNLEYYESLIQIIESYIHEKPDISIETCKALIESISKLILFITKQESITAHNKTDLSVLTKKAFTTRDRNL